MLEKTDFYPLTPALTQGKSLPDVAAATASEAACEATGKIDWVGMGRIELPVLLAREGRAFQVPARVDAFVSLDAPKAKGIHMSRLYLLTQDLLAQNKLNFDLLAKILDEFVKSHADLSFNAKISVAFDLMVRRQSLKSEIYGWRSYPVEMTAQSLAGDVKCLLSTEVLYSSTCPCSAALARQLIQKKFGQDFTEPLVARDEVIEWLGSPQGIVATPHSQRSKASVATVVKNGSFDPQTLIDLIEGSLKTPVQASVKRVDEQEFALLNGQNLMFCEDASRKIRTALENDERLIDYRIRVEHQESLHAHDAVSVIVKGIENGFQP